MGRPRKHQAEPQMFEATDSFSANIDGVDMPFSAGRTRVTAAWLQQQPRLRHLFRPLRPDYDVPAVEQATAAPGEKRG